MDRILDMEYLRSHPHLNFSLDLTAAGPAFYMLAGEARSKCEHIEGVPLRPATNDELHVLYLAKGIHGTTAIEGNSLTEEQVLAHLQGRLRLPAQQAYLAQELDNIIGTFNWAAARVLSGELPAITTDVILTLHRMILTGLPPEAHVVPGEIRTKAAVVADYLGPPARECRYLLDRLCGWINGPDFASRPDWGIALDVVKAAVAHLYVVWIHPFGDGNGRTARLVELITLMSAGVPLPASHLLSNHYNATRPEYYKRVGEARHSNAHVVAFIEYALAGFVEQLRAQIGVIKQQQMDQAWQDYVNESFFELHGPTAERQRLLALALGEQREPIPKQAMPRLTPPLAVAYAQKGPRTLSRDVNALVRAKLIHTENGGYAASTDILRAFMPAKAECARDETPNRRQSASRKAS